MGESAKVRVRSACLPVALLLATLSSACDSEKLKTSASPPTPRPLAGCETLDLSLCDTRQHDCQLSRLAIAACLRETDARALPQVTIMNPQDYADYWNAQNE